MGHSNSPYVRLMLHDTLPGRPDPLSIVDGAASRLQDALDHRLVEGESHEAYDVLASWGKLRRVRPELLTQVKAGDLMSRVERFIRQPGEVVELALTVPNTEGWVEEAIGFDASYEEDLPEAERVRWAGQLITDLDDAELVAAVAEELGHADAELKSDLDSCRSWLRKRPDLFYAAALGIQGIGQSLRPDLAVAEPRLVRTAEKYIWLLDAFVGVEEELYFSRQRPLSREELFSIYLAWQRSQQRPPTN